MGMTFKSPKEMMQALIDGKTIERFDGITFSLNDYEKDYHHCPLFKCYSDYKICSPKVEVTREQLIELQQEYARDFSHSSFSTFLINKLFENK